VHAMQEYVFSNLLIQSNKDNKIAFQVNVTLLLKTFAAASTIDADAMQVRSMLCSSVEVHSKQLVQLCRHTAPASLPTHSWTDSPSQHCIAVLQHVLAASSGSSLYRPVSRFADGRVLQFRFMS
jgi:hypothetical protein